MSKSLWKWVKLGPDEDPVKVNMEYFFRFTVRKSGLPGYEDIFEYEDKYRIYHQVNYEMNYGVSMSIPFGEYFYDDQDSAKKLIDQLTDPEYDDVVDLSEGGVLQKSYTDENCPDTDTDTGPRSDSIDDNYRDDNCDGDIDPDLLDRQKAAIMKSISNNFSGLGSGKVVLEGVDGNDDIIIDCDK